MNIEAIDVRKPDAELIEHLEKLLNEAKKGELVGISYVAVWHGNSVSSSWCQMRFSYLRTVIGELYFLKHKLIDAELYP